MYRCGSYKIKNSFLFLQFCEKWLAQFPILAADSEADEIHDVIIGVHAVQQLLRANSTVSELRNEHVDQDHVAFLDAWLRKFSNEKQSKNADESLLKLIAQFSMKNFHRSQEECEEVLSTSGSFEEKYPRKKVRKEEIVGKEDNCFEDVNNEADMTPSYSTVTHTSQGVGNSDSVENHPRINSRRGFKRNRKYGDGIKLILTKGLWVYDDEAKKRILPILNVDCYSSILEIEMQQLKHLLGNVHTEEEIIACRIEQGVPLTRKDYCSNSNCILSTGKNLNMEEKLKEPMRPKDSRSGNTKESSGNIERIVFECNRCGNVTLQSINYQVLIDLAVFPYLLRDLRIPTMSERSGFIYLEKSLEILPISRSYRTYDELGEHNYTLQCYHATHLVYIYTDWGKYPVNRQLFAEEFDFILRNMHIAIWLKVLSTLISSFFITLRVFITRTWR